MSDPFAPSPSPQMITSVTPPTFTGPYYEGLEYTGENTDAYALDGWTAQALSGSHWYLCDQCGLPFRKRQTTRNVLTLEQTGLRVCYRCLDEPGMDDRREFIANRLAAIQAKEADSMAKEP